ncbi:MAG TPA: hypothetical protein VGM08_01370 [Candidatus Saccharimonadales bacterium]|jgi:cytoskeletal protein RodZ
MEEEPDKDHRKAVITFLAFVIIAVIVVATVVASPKKQDASTSASTGSGAGTAPSSATGSSAESGTATDASFKDGSYTATGSYESPGGNQRITVQVTLKSGVITDTSATSGAQDPESQEYQGMFIGGYKSQVVGKDIADVHLSRVSGSSLTSQGFNDAISQIENQAKA